MWRGARLALPVQASGFVTSLRRRWSDEPMTTALCHIRRHVRSLTQLTVEKEVYVHLQLRNVEADLA
jgi:hypothetical protein